MSISAHGFQGLGALSFRLPKAPDAWLPLPRRSAKTVCLPCCCHSPHRRPIPFESQQFKGQAAIYIAGLPSAPAGLFKGQKRRTLVVVQVRCGSSPPLPLLSVGGSSGGTAWHARCLCGAAFSRADPQLRGWLVAVAAGACASSLTFYCLPACLPAWLQGQFTDSVGFDDLVTGQEFARAKNLPPAWLMDGVLLKVGRRGATPAGRPLPRHMQQPRQSGPVCVCSGDAALRPEWW